MSYFFNPKARIEHLEHVAYYESQQKGLGRRYIAAFSSAMTKVCATPHRRRPDYWVDRILAVVLNPLSNARRIICRTVRIDWTYFGKTHDPPRA